MEGIICEQGNHRACFQGAQLRRAGEVKLKEDVRDCLKEWKGYLDEACFVFLSAPKTMSRTFYDAGFLSKDSKIIRKIPLDVSRPTFEAVCAVHKILTTLEKRTSTEEERRVFASFSNQPVTQPPRQAPPKQPQPSPVTPPPAPAITPLTPLHLAARSSDLDAMTTLLLEHDANSLAGPQRQAPLHLAASSPLPSAPQCVSLLLKNGADPRLLDAQGSLPYRLCNPKTRMAFRTSRAALGEDAWDWKAAGVDDPLTDAVAREKKEREREKKRRQRKSQKEKKAREMLQKEKKAQEILREEREREEEAGRAKKEEDAKRIRDCLLPKTNTNCCDFCQTSCSRKSKMYGRLEYSYCSTDCVTKHKRELMAAAAARRMG